MRGRRFAKARRGALVALLALAPLTVPATGQDAGDATTDATTVAAEGAVAGADVEATGFLVADATYAPLPEIAPEPRPKPLDPEDRSENDAADVAANDAGVADGPLDDDGDGTIGPDDLPSADVPETADPGDMPDLDAIPPVRRQLAESDAEFAQCTAALEALGTVFEPTAPLTETKDPDCGIARPILVTEIVPGVTLRPDAVMRCATARALAEWVEGDVVPAADALGATVTAVDHGSTYICRRRNNRPTGKLSEHSFGNAVDVMGFRFAERDAVRIEPREPGGPVATFQRTVRESSCEHFTTVIGPGTDAAHADHIHLDIKERRGDYRLCQ